MPAHRVVVVDSHTEGEPTRVVVSGGPDLPQISLSERVEILRKDHDSFRAGVCCEPRGSEVVVGALLVPPVAKECVTGVIFFNDVGYLGMCGHGTIGVLRTLAHLGRLDNGVHRIETPVGVVKAELMADGSVRVDNVESYCYKKSVSLDVPGLGHMTGDIAWGGNWFFLVRDREFEVSLGNRQRLLAAAHAIRDALSSEAITGRGGEVIDHIELFGAPSNPDNDSRNFVLCPGASYDRSPCGTGTSAKMACLFADGLLPEGQEWRQEGILGTHFTGSVIARGTSVLPSIQGRAWVTAESTLLFETSDPFRGGISLE